MKTLFAEIILPLFVQGTYTYRVPNELNDEINIGHRVMVQFGKTRFYTGIVFSIHENPPKNYTAKYIDSIVDEYPLINSQQLSFWEWLAFYYCCSIGEVMNAALPSGLKLSSETNLSLNPENDWSEEDLNEFNETEKSIIETLSKKNNVPLKSFESQKQSSSLRRAVQNLLKAGKILTFEEIRDKFKPHTQKYIGLSAELSEDEIKKTITLLEKRAFKQLQAFLFCLSEIKKTKVGLVLKSEIIKHSDSASVSALIKKKLFIEKEIETGRLKNYDEQNRSFTLSETQQTAYQKIKSSFQQKQVALLHGITGSGKTEIYFKLAEEQIDEGKQVLYLVPEIALTTQLITRFVQYFGNQVGVYHSRFSENERVEIWNAVQPEHHLSTIKKEYKIIVGARSALFLPFQNLGLIIVDEEHESSYKQQDPAPRYHARDAALFLANNIHHCSILLGSATPSIESYFNAKNGKYDYVELNERFGEANLPSIHAVKKPSADKAGVAVPLLSNELQESVQKALKNKEQIILFQNRRGFAPTTECRQCGWIPQCPNCDVSLIYHKNSNRLSCHYCGHGIEPPSRCESCRSHDLLLKGAGTEKIEEDVALLFPEANIARLDLDNTRSKNAYHQIISEFSEGKTNILVGTQMVSKGLDFANVSVVGILNADQLLSFPDFRAHEKSFQMMTQVSGRAGRKDKAGHVFIQSQNPENEIIRLVINHDYKSFFTQCIADRQQYNYPPFCRLIEFTVQSKDLIICENAAFQLAENLRTDFDKQVLGPEFPLIARVKNEFRKRILLKIMKNQSTQKVRESIRKHTNAIVFDNSFKNVRIIINVDPQ